MTKQHIGDPKAGSRPGCALVLLPLLALLIVMPDAVHIWPQPWANPLLWLIGSIAFWLVLRWSIDKAASQLGWWPRLIVYGLLLAFSATLATLIVWSFYGPNGYVQFISLRQG